MIFIILSLQTFLFRPYGIGSSNDLDISLQYKIRMPLLVRERREPNAAL